MNTAPVLAGLLILPLSGFALEVPVQRATGGQPLVEATTGDGRKVPCLFDTGATHAVLAPTLPDRGRDRPRGEMAASGAGGSGYFTAWGIRGWRLGTQALPEFSALVADLGAATPCVFGPAALGESTLELDLVQNRLRAGRFVTAPAGAAPTFDAVQGFIRLRLPFPAGGTATWILDTGAGTSVLNRRAAALLGLDPQRPSTWAERRGLDGGLRRHRVHAVSALSLLPGGAGLERVEVAELPVLERLGVDRREPGGLLGADVLAGHRLLLDLERHRWSIGP